MPKEFEEKSQNIMGWYKNDRKWGLMIFFRWLWCLGKTIDLTYMSWMNI